MSTLGRSLKQYLRNGGPPPRMNQARGALDLIGFRLPKRNQASHASVHSILPPALWISDKRHRSGYMLDAPLARGNPTGWRCGVVFPMAWLPHPGDLRPCSSGKGVVFPKTDRLAIWTVHLDLRLRRSHRPQMHLTRQGTPFGDVSCLLELIREMRLARTLGAMGRR